MNKIKFKKNIIDVGAFNGIDGLALALKNTDAMVNAFEANKDLISSIKSLKYKIEKRIGRSIKNYKIHNLAVSNCNRYSNFYIAKNPTVSSLNQFSENIEKFWPGYKDSHCHTIKKYKVKTITLNRFCKENMINIINYLHTDTQGNDLKVLKGLGSRISIINKGFLEASISKKKSLYKKNHTIFDVKIFLKKNNFFIETIEPVHSSISNEVNICYINNIIDKNNMINNKYNSRYFKRVLSDQTYFKDDLKDFIIRQYNKIIKNK